MPDRLTPIDVSLLHQEDSAVALHVGGVAILDPPPGGFDRERFGDLVWQRIGRVPRFRQRLMQVPARLGSPVWVDDEQFDLGYHVRQAALPRPGTHEQLRELAGRLMSRKLDPARPLWEMYVVEGLEGGRLAIITKVHQVMIDAVHAPDLATVLFDTMPRTRITSAAPWQPEREPGSLRLVTDAITDAVRHPLQMLDAVRIGPFDLRTLAGRLATVTGVLFVAARFAVRPAPRSALNGPIGRERLYATASTRLDDYRRIRKAYGVTVNDVVLTTVAGALRAFLHTRGEFVPLSATVRALVPVSVYTPEEQGRLGDRVTPYLVDLPIGEPNPVLRLHRVSFAMKAHHECGQAVGAEPLTRLPGFAPQTLHGLGARSAGSLSRHLFNLVVVNVPGPQAPLYAAGAPLLETYPVLPLLKEQALSIGVTSYDGGVYFGLNADRAAMADADVLADCIPVVLEELRDTVGEVER